MPAAKPTVLVVERESAATTALLAFLRGYGLRISWARDGDVAGRTLTETRVDALVAPLRAPRIDGVALCRRAREHHPDACVVLSAGAARPAMIAAALAAGAFDVLPRPVGHERLLAVLERGFAHRRLAARLREAEARLDERFAVAPFTGRSRAITRVMEQVRHLASTHTAVLIEGEVGTGKRLAARAIHQNSPRRNESLVEIDCGALSEPLLERELFGREAGDPTDGDAAQRGRLESADGGTLLLNEIDELPSGVQVRLLRVLQDHAFERVGGQATLKVDVRMIATTRTDLDARVREGRFRGDLFQRLGMVRIVMPPLRDRRDDLPMLVEQLLLEADRGRARGTRGVTRGVLDRLLAHPWPGNVRELRDTIESMVMVAGRGRPLGLADLPQALRPDGTGAAPLEISAGMTVEEAERQLIAATLALARHDKPRTAALLGIGLRTLYRKLKEYRIG